MQREGKAPMIDNDNPPSSSMEDDAGCSYMLEGLRLGTPIENPPFLNTKDGKEASFSTSLVDASSYLGSCGYDAHQQPPPPRCQNPIPPLSYTSFGNSSGRLPFTAPPPQPQHPLPSPSPSPSIVSPDNYHPCNGYMNVPHPLYPHQIYAQQSIFNPIATPETSNSSGRLPFTTQQPLPSPSQSSSSSIVSPTNHHPCNGYMNLPHVLYHPNLQASRMQAQQSIFDTIATPEKSNRLTHNIQELQRTGSMSRFIQLMSDPPALLRYACDKNGSLELQKLIQTIQSSWPVMYKLTSALARGFPQVACDALGRRVIKVCFEELSFAQSAVLSTKMVEHCVTLATNQYGCICLNECIPLMESNFKDQVLKRIAMNCSYLAQDYYGTHVVQNAISRKHQVFTPKIVEQLRCCILSLATQKQGSHLVERCFGLSSTRKTVMEELLRLSSQEILELACHEFGNFVLQTALSPTWESPDVQNLDRQLRHVLSQIIRDLKQHPIGKNVYKKYKKTVMLSTSYRDVQCS